MDFAVGVVHEADAQVVVHGPLQLWVGAAENGDDVFEPDNERSDLGLGQGGLGGLSPELAFEGASLPVDLGDPVADDRRLGPLLEDLAVAGEFGLALFEPTSQVELDGLAVVVGELARFGEGGARGVDVVVVEQLAEPRVDAAGDGVLSHVDGLGMTFWGDRVLGGKQAPVVGPTVVPCALHLPSARRARHPA